MGTEVNLEYVLAKKNPLVTVEFSLVQPNSEFPREFFSITHI